MNELDFNLGLIKFNDGRYTPIIEAAEAWADARQHLVNLDILKANVSDAINALGKAECALRDVVAERRMRTNKEK